MTRIRTSIDAAPAGRATAPRRGRGGVVAVGPLGGERTRPTAYAPRRAGAALGGGSKFDRVAHPCGVQHAQHAGSVGTGGRAP